MSEDVFDITSSLVESLLCNLNVGLEYLLGTHKDASVPVPELWINCLVHPVLFGHDSWVVAVIVEHLNVIHHSYNHKLWEVWDLRGCSVEILEGVCPWRQNMKIYRHVRELSRVVLTTTREVVLGGVCVCVGGGGIIPDRKSVV